MFKYYNETNYLEAYCVKNYDYNQTSSISQIYVINFPKTYIIYAADKDNPTETMCRIDEQL